MRLLKNLEEPPCAHVFILIAHSPGQPAADDPLALPDGRLAPLDADEPDDGAGGVEPPPPDGCRGAAALAERAGGSVADGDPADAVWRAGNRRGRSTLWRQRGKIDIAGAYRLADAVGGRDQAIQFDIFNRHALDLLADAARAQAALAGDPARANR